MGEKLRLAIRGYELVAVLVIAGLVTTWPGWYREPTWNQIMTNAFATFLVLPVLIFGVDRALLRAQEVRERPRRDAIRAELTRTLTVMVNRGASGTLELLPGLLPRIFDVMNDRGIDAASDFTAHEVIRREAELTASITALPPDELKKLLASIASFHRELRETLFEAGPSLSAETYAETLALSRSVGLQEGQGRLLDIGIADSAKYDLDSKGGRSMRALMARDLAATLAAAARLYLALRAGRR